jgi:hypothetical protein
MSDTGSINEQEFRELCDIVLNGREIIWRGRDSQTPGLDDKVALLKHLEDRVWSKTVHEPRVLINVDKAPAEEFYRAIQKRIDEYGKPPFDSKPILDDMLNKALAEKNKPAEDEI